MGEYTINLRNNYTVKIHGKIWVLKAWEPLQIYQDFASFHCMNLACTPLKP